MKLPYLCTPQLSVHIVLKKLQFLMNQFSFCMLFRIHNFSLSKLSKVYSQGCHNTESASSTRLVLSIIIQNQLNVEALKLLYFIALLVMSHLVSESSC